MNSIIGKKIDLDGGTYLIKATGTVKETGEVYVHAYSIIRGRHQRNGFIPCQIGTYINPADVY